MWNKSSDRILSNKFLALYLHLIWESEEKSSQYYPHYSRKAYLVSEPLHLTRSLCCDKHRIIGMKIKSTGRLTTAGAWTQHSYDEIYTCTTIGVRYWSLQKQPVYLCHIFPLLIVVIRNMGNSASSFNAMEWLDWNQKGLSRRGNGAAIYLYFFSPPR